MSKLQLVIKNAPNDIGAKQLFDNDKHLKETLKSWEESQKMTKVSLKGSTLTFESEGNKGTGVIKEVNDDFQFEEESQD